MMKHHGHPVASPHLGSDVDFIAEIMPISRWPGKGPVEIMPISRWSGRGSYQKRLDVVDIPAPTFWLHQDVNSTLHLLRTSQAAFELGVPNGLWESRRENRLKISKIDYDAMGMAVPYEKRTIRGGRILPWGLWPARLRNLEGDTFYSNDYSESDCFNCVTEDSIHDELLRRRPELLPSSAVDGTVRRLLPGKLGYWVDATPKTLPVVAVSSVPPPLETSCLPPLDASGPVADVDEADARQSTGSRRPSTTIADSPLTEPTARDTVARKTRPGRYGGRVEVESYKSRGKRKRDALVASKAEFDLDPAVPKAQVEEVSFCDGQLKGQSNRRAHVANAMTSDRAKGGINRTRVACGPEDGGGEGGHEGDSRQEWVVAEPAKEAVRRVWARATRRSRDVFVPTSSAHAPPRTGEACVSDASETGQKGKKNRGASGGDYDENAGWDEHAGGSLSDGGWSDGRQEAAGSGPCAGSPAAERGSSEDGLDPELLSLLSRECEGIIDATLHVVLSRQHDRSRSSSGESAPSDPPSATDWQGVLRTFWGYSTASRRAESKDRSDPPGDAGGPRIREVWGAGDSSDGAVVVVDEQLPALPLNEAVITRSYNRLLLYLNEEKYWHP